MPRTHNATFARSGVQYYLANELPNLGLSSIPREFAHLRVFGVYRPSYMVEKTADMYPNLPVVVGHEHWVTGPEDPAIIGFTGDKSSVSMLNGECTIYGSIQYKNPAYDDKSTELSPGYVGKYIWAPGKTGDGVEFQIVMQDIKKLNHMALVPKARGGRQIRVLDGGIMDIPRRIVSGILRYAHKTAHGVGDADMGAFRNTIQDVVENRARWTSEEMMEHCHTLMVLTNDLPDSEQKEKLLRFITDIPLIAGEDDETAKQVGEAVAALYEQLDSDAMSDVIANKETHMAEKTEPAPASAAQPAPAGTEKTAAHTEDADPSAIPAAAPETASPEVPDTATAQMAQITPEKALYALQEIHLLLNKVFGENPQPANPGNTEVAPAPAATETPAAAPATPLAGKETPAEEQAEKKVPAPTPKEDKEAHTTDSMPEHTKLPVYTQTLDSHEKTASLDAVFEKMKGAH